jgi:hypothetical protein
MPFPNTRQALEANGYKFVMFTLCPSCEVNVEMWLTPRLAAMPLDFKLDEHGAEICVPHFSTCRTPAMYSRRLQKKAEDKKAAEDSPMTPDGEAL